jgi:hypothetical protein
VRILLMRSRTSQLGLSHCLCRMTLKRDKESSVNGFECMVHITYPMISDRGRSERHALVRTAFRLHTVVFVILGVLLDERLAVAPDSAPPDLCVEALQGARVDLVGGLSTCVRNSASLSLAFFGAALSVPLLVAVRYMSLPVIGPAPENRRTCKRVAARCRSGDLCRCHRPWIEANSWTKPWTEINSGQPD